MNIDKTKKREPLGQYLIEVETWKRSKIRDKLKDLGVNHMAWHRILTVTEAHKIPTYIRDIIVEELPETAPFFKHPKLHP